MPVLLIVALIVFLEGMSFTVLLPVLPPLTRDAGGTITIVGLLFALSTGPRVFFAPFWGRVSDRVGRRRVLLIATAGTLAASLLVAWCVMLGERFALSALFWLLLSRTLYGVFAVQSVVGSAIVSDITTPEKRAAGLGALGAGFGLAFALGPWVGGYVADLSAETTVGYLAAALQLLSLGLILFMLRETRSPRSEAVEEEATASSTDTRTGGEGFAPPSSLLHLITFPAVAWMLVICLLGTAAYSVLFPTFQPFAQDSYGWSLTKAGAALSVFGLVGAFVQGGMIRPTIKRLGERATAQMGLAILAIGLLWVATQPGEAGFWAAAIVMALGTGFSVPAVMAMLSLAVSETDQGSVHGLTQSATAGGRAIGYLLGGALFTAISPAFAYAAAGVIAAAMVVMLLAPLAGHRHDAKAPADAETARSPR